MAEMQIIAQRPEKTIYRDGDKTVKVFSNNFSVPSVLNEALNLARVGEGTLHVPKLHEVTKIDGRWAIVYDHIEGESIAELMEKYPERHDELLEMFVDIQIRMHKERIPLLTKLKDKMNRKIDQSELSATIRYELHTRLEGMPRHDKLCHGDFNTANIVLTSDGTPYILDWAHATQGNASADVARTYLMYCLRGMEAEAERYLTLFCDKTNTARSYVRTWFPIVAASQSVKGKPEEREFLFRWANVMDFE